MKKEVVKYNQKYLVEGGQRLIFIDRKGMQGKNQIFTKSGAVAYINEYYPFGLQNQQTSSTQFGSKPQNLKYNEKELHKEFNLEQYNYGNRMYNPQIGRFNITDKFASKYMEMTPYHYGANNPIKYIDVNGDSLWIIYGGSNILYNNGALFNKDGSSYAGEVKGFLSDAVNALKQIANTSEGGAMVGELQSSANNFYLESTDGNSNFEASDKTSGYANQMLTDPEYAQILERHKNAGTDLTGGSGGKIQWNTSGALLATTKGGKINGTTDLAHEMFHAFDGNRGLLDRRNERGWKRDEWQATYRENVLRGEMGLPLRTHYSASQDTFGTFGGGLGPRMLTPANQPLLPAWYKK